MYNNLYMQKAFSLVELSIVLVILGLLTGGILGGQALIRAAELRSISSDLSSYQTTINTFKDKYFSMPGDMPNALLFWPADTTSNCTHGTGTDQTPKLLTCNGNGDGRIVGTQYNESWRVWQHLANAGLISGQFSGHRNNLTDLNIFGGGTACGCFNAKAGVNVPLTKFSNVGPMMMYDDTTDGSEYSPFANNVIYYGRDNVDKNKGEFLLPEELYNIDVKMDDGLPATGQIRGQMWSCGSGNVAATARYRLDVRSQNCYVTYIVQ